MFSILELLINGVLCSVNPKTLKGHDFFIKKSRDETVQMGFFMLEIR